MKAIALYERNPSSYVTKRHHNACLPNKPVHQYLTVERAQASNGCYLRVFISNTNGGTQLRISDWILNNPSISPIQISQS